MVIVPRNFSQMANVKTLVKNRRKLVLTESGHGLVFKFTDWLGLSGVSSLHLRSMLFCLYLCTRGPRFVCILSSNWKSEGHSIENKIKCWCKFYFGVWHQIKWSIMTLSQLLYSINIVNAQLRFVLWSSIVQLCLITESIHCENRQFKLWFADFWK